MRDFLLDLLIRQRLRCANRLYENVKLIKKERHVPDRSGIFDCDGTLVDSEVICSRAYVTMFQEFGITLDPEEVFKRFKGVKLYEIIDIVSLEHGVTLAKTEAEHVYRAEVARLFDSELEAIEGAGALLSAITAPMCGI